MLKSMIKPSLEEFFFRTPLYEAYQNTAGLVFEKFAEFVLIFSLCVDGHCPHCGRTSTFQSPHGPCARIHEDGFGRKTVKGNAIWDSFEKGTTGVIFGLQRELICARAPHHTLRFWLNVRPNSLTKVGQDPSLADIANDASKIYRSVLSKEDSSELHKAIGLAAHGVGIGSFVYLRRIFERLIQARFKTFENEEGWSNSDFQRLRMPEKIEFLKDHLPSFLVENKKIYSILSQGLHELSEEGCLKFFTVLEKSTLIILEEDKKKREELELRKQAQKAIANFQAPATTQETHKKRATKRNPAAQ